MSTSALMAKSGRKPKHPGAGKGKRSGANIYANVDPRIRKALTDYLLTVKPATTMTAVVELALMEYFERHGFWPPKS